MAKAELKAFMEKYRITVGAEFVPLSRSRNANKKDGRGKPRLTLNWRVTLAKAGRDILTTDYSAGVAHCPAHKRIKNQFRPTMDEWAAVEWECEKGKAVSPLAQHSFGLHGSKPIQPDSLDVLYSLASDSDVINCGTFEEWASNLGYDTDSRKAEAIYRACLEIALKLRNGLGETALPELREACQGY